MTSTEFTIGFTDRARASSKVLKPPGGGSSDIFGTQSSQSQPAARNADSTQNRLFGSTEPHSTASKPDRLRSNIFDVPATSSPKSTPRKFVSRNPITGEVMEIKPTNGSEDGEAVQDDEVSEGVATNGADVNDNAIDNPETNATEKSSDTEVANNEKDPVRGDGPEPAVPTQTCIRIRNPPGGKSSGIF